MEDPLLPTGATDLVKAVLVLIQNGRDQVGDGSMLPGGPPGDG